MKPLNAFLRVARAHGVIERGVDSVSAFQMCASAFGVFFHAVNAYDDGPKRVVLGPDSHLDEAIFVPAGPGEDEGYLLAFMYERQTNQSSVIILDASNWAALLIARIKIPARVPIGLHLYWLPNSVLHA